MSATIETLDIDHGFVGHSVRMYFPKPDYSLTFPPVTIGDLALELAGMLRADMPGAEVSVVRHGCFSGERPEAEDITARIERRVIEARKAEQPGKAFLRALGYWGSSPAEHQNAAPRD